MNNRGSAMAEALPVTAMLLLSAAAILTGIYLIFAQAWINYQSEQTLYCLAEKNLEALCRSRLAEKLKTGLPFGQPGKLELKAQGDLWRVKTQWQVRGIRLVSAKEMGVRRILRNKALRW